MQTALCTASSTLEDCDNAHLCIPFSKECSDCSGKTEFFYLFTILPSNV